MATATVTVAPALAGGNTVVALASETSPLAALTLGEVLATSDFPAGVVNLISGFRKELLPWLASHMDVNAIDVSGCTSDEVALVEVAAGVCVALGATTLTVRVALPSCPAWSMAT